MRILSVFPGGPYPDSKWVRVITWFRGGGFVGGGGGGGGGAPPLAMAGSNNFSRAGGWVDPMEEEALSFKRKSSRTLEDIVRSTQKVEAQLIGFEGDQITSNEVEGIQFIDAPWKGANEASAKSSKKFLLISSSVGSQETETSTLVTAFKGEDELIVPHEMGTNVAMLKSSHNKTNGLLGNKTARSRLFEACAANHWNPPLFELCEERSGHLGKFTYKVTVEVETISSTLLECFGEPRTQKKAAQEHVAEGAIWYLNHLGYLPEC